MKKIILAVSLLALVVSLSAQKQKWSLRQCIDYAVENNIQIKQQQLQVQTAENNLSTTKLSRLPNLEASVNQTFSFGQIVDYNTNTNISNNASGARLSVSSSLPIFTGFSITNQIKENKLNLLAATEGLKKVKENLELQVTSYFLDILFKGEILKTYQEQASLTSTQVQKTQQMVEVGKVPKSQLFDIKAQLAKDELNVTTAKNSLDLAFLDLSQLLNLKTYSDFNIQEPISIQGDILEEGMSRVISPDDIYQLAIAIKPHVKEGEYLVEASKKAFKVAQSAYYPTLSFNMGYGTSVQRRYNSSNASFRNQFNDNGSEYLGFTLSVPIFNRFQTRNRVRSARIDIVNQQLNLDNTKLTLYKEIQQAYQSAIAAQAKYVSTGKAYDAANQSFSYAQERYNIGKSTVFEFNEAQTKLRTSKAEQIQAKYDFLFRSKILDFYRGIEIDIK